MACPSPIPASTGRPPKRCCSRCISPCNACDADAGHCRFSFFPKPVTQEQRQPANVQQRFPDVLLDPPPIVPYPENCDHVNQAVQSDPSPSEGPLALLRPPSCQRNS